MTANQRKWIGEEDMIGSGKDGSEEVQLLGGFGGIDQNGKIGQPFRKKKKRKAKQSKIWVNRRYIDWNRGFSIGSPKHDLKWWLSSWVYFGSISVVVFLPKKKK